MWFTGVEVEQETSAPPPKKNFGSAPVLHSMHANTLECRVRQRWWFRSRIRCKSNFDASRGGAVMFCRLQHPSTIPVVILRNYHL